MKKRNMIWGAFFAMILAVLPLFLVSAAVLLPAQYDDTYLGELQEKRTRLEEVKEKKLIVAGGSSVAFGIRSDLMEEQLGMPVVNWGLYAPLGSRTMLELCFDEIGPGDIVVFSPEQNPETLSFSFQAESVWQALDGDFSLLTVFREEELKPLIGAFPEFAVSKLRYASGGKPETTGIYQKDSFNEYGDISSGLRAQNQMESGYDPTQMIDFSYFPDKEFLQYLNEYAARVREKGAEFYYRLCPMNRLAVQEEEKVDEWFLRMEEEAEFLLLGDPHRCIMDSGWFFDTNFHLNEAGAVVNSYYFVRDLKAQLKDSSVTDMELPELPQRAEEAAEEKADSEEAVQAERDKDADCFLCREEGAGLVITGVTEEGRSREELTLPQSIGGKKVTGLQAGSLRDCTKLRRVTIYGGIALYDGCFGECGTLREIVLMAEPWEITAGKDLMQDSRADLYPKYIEEYRLDYSWALYSDRMKEYRE